MFRSFLVKGSFFGFLIFIWEAKILQKQSFPNLKLCLRLESNNNKFYCMKFIVYTTH